MKTIKIDLKNIHTRNLLKWLKKTRKFDGFYRFTQQDEYPIKGVYYDDLKDELKTREHIPNKRERKAIRKAKQINKQVR